jgi:hypothetical protein
MTKDFEYSAPDMLKFIQLHKKARRRLGYAVANLLTSQAFGTRRKAIQAIDQKMTIRNQPFIVGAVRYTKANGRKSINAQFSEVGSIRRPRFSGLAEQETGQKTKRSRVFTQLARRDNMSNVVQGPARLKAANRFLKPKSIGGMAGKRRVTAFLAMLKRDKYKKPFIISGHRKFKKGLYKFHRNRLVKLQDFQPRKVQPKRVKWLTLGRIRYFKSVNTRKQWHKALKRIYKI